MELAHEQNWQIENQPESFRKGDEDGDFELLDPHLATIYKRTRDSWLLLYYQDKLAKSNRIQFV